MISSYLSSSSKERLSVSAATLYATCTSWQRLGIYLLDPSGKKINRDTWEVLYADSEELGGDDGNAANVFDLQFTSFWYTQWQEDQPGHPHLLILDLGSEQKIGGMLMLPRQDSPNGRIRDYEMSRNLFKGV